MKYCYIVFKGRDGKKYLNCYVGTYADALEYIADYMKALKSMIIEGYIAVVSDYVLDDEEVVLLSA